MYNSEGNSINKTEEVRVDHKAFFEKGSLTKFEVDGLEEYMFYVFTVAYQTNHSVGNFTHPFVVRTREGGKDLSYILLRPVVLSNKLPPNRVENRSSRIKSVGRGRNL